MSKSSSESVLQSSGDLVISLRDCFKYKGIALILASQSPRRREILDMMGLKDMYDTIPSPLDESALQLELIEKGVTDEPQKYTQTLAEEKARSLAESIPPVARPTLILGSDTIVDQDEAILEKPKNKEDAERMLRKLSGREHFVHTGVALYRCLPGSSPELMISFVDQATVQFTELSDADIHAYVESGEPMDKAGSYGIQGIGGQFVSRVEGDFFTVSFYLFVFARGCKAVLAKVP